jgi:dual specificity phosphatase 12
MNSAPAHEIVPRIWLGNKNAASDPDWLKTHGITVVFNCTKDYPFHHSILRQYRLPVDDNLEASEIQNMYDWAPETQYKLISEYKRGETILVHCHAGMQRSAAVVAMFLIAMHGMTPASAIAYIKQKRPIAFFPSANFGKSIQAFEGDMKKYKYINKPNAI